MKKFQCCLAWSTAGTLCGIFLAFFNPAAHAFEADLTKFGPNQGAPEAWQVVERDANSQVWARTEPLAGGGARVHRYTELATGLNYWHAGRWTPSRAEIELLPDGRAAATHGQHQAFFPGDIYAGQIETVSADERHWLSRPLGLAYADGSNTVWLAGLQSTTGFLQGSNQVIYVGAFAGCQADLRYTYTLAGFEQDIILRQRPPAPEAFGLNPRTTRLQVLTEFFGARQPQAAARFHDPELGLTDHELTFGRLKMIQGSAFAQAGPRSVRPPTPVFKSWHTAGDRHYLVEEVPVSRIQAELQGLPPADGASPGVAPGNLALNRVAATLLLPEPRPTVTVTAIPRLARAGHLGTGGYVLDYVTYSYTSVKAGFTFQSDTTYFLSNAYFADQGQDVIEGGTVVKFDQNTASINFLGPSVVFATSPWRPAIFTAKDDNTVGEIIAGSTGNPSGYYGYGSHALYFSYYNETVSAHDLRASYFGVGIQFVVNKAQLQNVQFLNCATAVAASWDNVTVNNALFANDGICVANWGGSPNLAGNFITAHNCQYFAAWMNAVTLTNCLFAGVSNANLTCSSFITNNVASVPNDAGIFKTAGAGGNYLADGSPYWACGTTNVGAASLANIAARTTHAPQILAATNFTTPQVWLPQTPRDTNTLPDLGYHYDPVDYITDQVGVTNTSLAISNGVIIACYNRPGITLLSGASLISVGTPVQPNWFVRYQNVQEGAVALGGTNVTGGQNVAVLGATNAPVTGWFSFTHFAMPENGGTHFTDLGNTAYGSLILQHTEIWGGSNNFSGGTASQSFLWNNLFYRCALAATNASTQTCLAFSNNLLLNAKLTLVQPGAGGWAFFDNALDGTTVATNSAISNGFNAYFNCPFALTGASNIVATNSPGYQSGPLGTFYQPAGSPLINAGSTTADQAGLYQFTTLTNQTKETNSVLDIGYHYVAVGANGQPLDNNQDGVPDYLQDANGNGIPDNGETPWQGLPVIVSQPASQILYPGGTNFFTATVTGLSLGCQWYYNSNALAGTTNATLELDNVTTNNAGTYYLVATNFAGSVTSSNASLALLPAPVFLTQPARQTVLVTTVANFSASVNGLNTAYQWYSNGVAVAGATNLSLTICAYTTNAAGNYYLMASNFSGVAVSSNAMLTVTPITSMPVVYAASGQFMDVSNAVANARGGTAVVLPPGIFVWTHTLGLGACSLRGCGTNQTIIVDEVPGAENGGILINAAAGQNPITEISNFQIRGGVTNTTVLYSGAILIGGSQPAAWRVDNMFFNGVYNKNISAYGNCAGLVDHNLFEELTVCVFEGNYGDQYASFALPPTYGLSSSNELYIEDNYFTNTTSNTGQIEDGEGGARFVVRYNTIWNDGAGNHGTETGGSVRSQRTFEFYGNTFNFMPGILSPNYNSWFTVFFLRGGCGVIFSNTASGYNSLATIRNFRNTDAFSGVWAPYGGATGTNPWDTNGPGLFLAGTNTGPNGVYYLQLAGANWTTNQWVGYTVNDFTVGRFSEITSNTADTLYYCLNAHLQTMACNTGDSFAIYQVYVALDQLGRGAGDLLQDNGMDTNGNLIVINTTTGTPAWPHQALEGVYFWGNTLNGNSPVVTSDYPSIQAGRDFYNNTPIPGYKPYTYPHPLTLQGVH